MEIVKNNIISVLVLCINLFTTISYFIIYSKPALKTRFFKLPAIIQKVYVFFFVAPLFISPFIHQNKFLTPNLLVIIVGAILSLMGILLIIFSFLKIGVIPSIKNDGGLSTTGMYKLVRHPIYAGTIITQIGLTLCNRSLISLLYIPVSIMLYYIMATIEEKDLVNMFGTKYLEYQTLTRKKIIPFII